MTVSCTLCTRSIFFFPIFLLVPPKIQSWLVVWSSTRRHLAMHHATGLKTAGDWGVLDLQLLLGEWDFYEAAAISLAYRVLKMFMAGWDLLEAPSWNVMEFPIRECPQESGRAWFPGTRRCQRAGFMESNFLSKEKICSRDGPIAAPRLCPPRFNGLPQQAVHGDRKDEWVLPALAASKLFFPSSL